MEGLIFGILRYLKKDLALVRPKRQTNACKRLTTLYRPYKFSLELETWINTPNKISFKLIVKYILRKLCRCMAQSSKGDQRNFTKQSINSQHTVTLTFKQFCGLLVLYAIELQFPKSLIETYKMAYFRGPFLTCQSVLGEVYRPFPVIRLRGNHNSN